MEQLLHEVFRKSVASQVGSRKTDPLMAGVRNDADVQERPGGRRGGS